MSRPEHVPRLILAAHYDSKSWPKGFVGTVDIAVSCAMMLHIATAIDESLSKTWNNTNETVLRQQQDFSAIQIIFFDGEEQLKGGWNDYDGFYGSRELARKWQATNFPTGSKFPDAISSIRLFVLLDLLGAKSPTIPSYFQSTRTEYLALPSIEKRLARLGLPKSLAHPFLIDTKNGSGDDKTEQALLMQQYNKNGRTPPPRSIQDDHIAFLERGVDILCLIPSLFPKVWHKMQDDAEHIDSNVMADWTRMLTALWRSSLTHDCEA